MMVEVNVRVMSLQAREAQGPATLVGVRKSKGKIHP